MIEFDRYGNGEHKVLGIHGWFGDENTFKSLESSLDPADFECAWLAHRGYGRSRDIPGRYDMVEMANDAIAVADRLGWSSFSLIGHSMGGKAAQLLAALVPGRVDKLIAVSPVLADPVPFDKPTRELFEQAAESPEHRTAIVQSSVANATSPTWVSRVVENSVTRYEKTAFASYFKSWSEDDFSDVIRDMEVDTLVIVGAQDPVITLSVCEYGFRQRYRHLTVTQLQASGHYPMEEVPLRFGAQVLHHLKR